MFTAAGNIAIGQSESFLDALDTIKWNKKVSDDISKAYQQTGYGFSGSSAISPVTGIAGSNNKPILDATDGYFVTGFEDSADKIIVPPGFEPIRGENVEYADTLPPLTKVA
jgi:hypothetical protein